MGYSYVFLGDVAFPSASRCAEWRACLLAEETFDTPREWAPERDAERAEDAVEAFEGELSSVVWGDASLALRALVDKSGDGFLSARGDLVQAFRRAAAFEGSGSLQILGWSDYPGSFGLRVSIGGGTSSIEELDDDEVRAAEKSPAYAEVEGLVARMTSKVEDLIAKGARLLAERDAASRAAIADAADMAQVLERLPGALPSLVVYGVKESMHEHPAVVELAARHDANADDTMRARLGALVGGAFTGGRWKTAIEWPEKIEACALAHALFQRKHAEDEVLAMWIESPSWFLRDHERVRRLGRPELDVRLAAMLGTWRNPRETEENHRWVVEALFASDPDGAPARATALLDGDIRERRGAIESLRWVVGSLAPNPHLDRPEWRAFLCRVVEAAPPSPERYDMFDQIRASAIEAMAVWKMPEALPLLREHFARFGVEHASELLVALGDPAGVPLLEEALARATKKPERARLAKALAALGGTVPDGAAPPPATGHVVEPAASGRASCRGCKAKIVKGELRFGEAVENRYADSDEPTMRWYHLRCAAEKKAKLFGPVLATYAGEVPDRAALEATVAEKTQKKARKPRKPKGG